MRGRAIAEIIGEWQRASIDLPAASNLKPSDLPKAAAAFALTGVPRYAKAGWPELFWPWRSPRFRPGDRRDNLVRAGALLLAEIERLDRQGK